MKIKSRFTACIHAFICASGLLVLNSASGVIAQVLPTAGIGMSGSNYYTPAHFYNNAFHRASKWLNSTPADTPRDALGWPTALIAGTTTGVPLIHSYAEMPLGEYRLEWDGNGQLSLKMLSGSMQLLESGTNFKRYNISAAGSLNVIWNSTEPAPNHVKNVRVWMPGQVDSSALLHPDIVAEHEPFEVIRFMDWSHTNDNPEMHWADRVLPGAAIWNRVPWEACIDAANEMQVDAWINVPHKATDAYVTELATLIRDRLAPNARCWVEYSNEVWNWNFDQSNWVNDNIAGSNIDEKYATRAGQIFDIFNTVFANPERIVRVCATQTAYTTRVRRLDYLESNVDVLAITSYFAKKGDSQWIVDNWPVSNAQFAAKMQADVNSISLALWQHNIDYAANRGIPTVTYEGHCHFIPDKTLLTTEQYNWANNYQTSQEVADVYGYTLDMLRDMGLKTHIAFADYGTPSDYGFWGHREYPTQPLSEAHMWRELLEWMAEAPLDIVETLDSASLPATFGSGTFTGAGGFVWSYSMVKASTEINGPSAWLHRNGNGGLSVSAEGNISSISVDCKAKMNVASEIEIFVNGSSLGTSGPILKSEGVVTVVYEGLDFSGALDIHIESISGGETIVDNIQFQ